MSPFLAYVPQEDLAAHRSQMVTWTSQMNCLAAATESDGCALSSLILKGMYLVLLCFGTDSSLSLQWKTAKRLLIRDSWNQVRRTCLKKEEHHENIWRAP